MHKLYRRNNDASLPDWKLEESDSLEYRWQPYEDPAPEMPKHRGRDVRYCAVNQRKYDWGKGQFREGVCEELGVDRRMVKALTELGNRYWARECWRKHRKVEAHVNHYEKQEGKWLCVLFSKVDILNFIGFQLRRGLRGATIQSYMSSVRAVHIYKGYTCPALKDGVV